MEQEQLCGQKEFFHSERDKPLSSSFRNMLPDAAFHECTTQLWLPHTLIRYRQIIVP
jgi:hypothetical protein